MEHPSRPSVAVIGAGVSGLTAAWLLRHTHDVTVLEADDRFGGHAHTHTVPTVDGRELRIDSGFIVHNERTYPHLLRLFDELGVATQPTEMSMSITCDACRISYAGGRGLRGILAQPWRAADPRFVRMLTEVPRFHRAARALLDGEPSRGGEPRRGSGGDHGDGGRGDGGRVAHDADPTWSEFLAAHRFSDDFVAHFALPLVACVWSSGGLDARDYPARHLFAFLDHHGMLSVGGSPTWRTVTGGSGAYVDRLVAALPEVVRRSPVTAVVRHDDGVDVTAGGRVRTFDQVVLATHADTALELLADATPQEKSDLASIRYSRNETWLHRDSSILPREPAARASWNYRIRSCAEPTDHVQVSYWMNLLHGIRDEDDHVVTLNPDAVDPATVTARMTYDHPIFTREAVAAAGRLRVAGGPRLAFAGAHLGWGFHEDGCRSGVEAAERLGGGW